MKVRWAWVVVVAVGLAACGGVADPAPPAVVAGSRQGDREGEVEVLLSSCAPLRLREVEVFSWTQTPKELPGPVSSTEVEVELSARPHSVKIDTTGAAGSTVAVGLRTDDYGGVGDMAKIAVSGLDQEHVALHDGSLLTEAEFDAHVAAVCRGRGGA
jgi:hypothetical protein